MTIMTFYNILYNYPTFKFCCLKLWPGSRTASWLTWPRLAATLPNTNGNISSRKIKSRKMKFATKINILFSGRGNQLCPVYWIISRPFSNYNKIWHLTFVFKINENWRHTFSKARPLHSFGALNKLFDVWGSGSFLCSRTKSGLCSLLLMCYLEQKRLTNAK